MPVTITQVLKTCKGWDGTILPGFTSGKTELKVLHYRLVPRGTTPIHLHPINGAGYILSGELTMISTRDPHGDFSDRKKIKQIKLKAGEAWAESVNVWHYGVNKGKVDVEFIVIFAGYEGAPPTLSLGTRIKC